LSDAETGADWLAEQIHEPSAQGIAATITALVRSGQLPPDARLPTVRSVAARLGVSPATVSSAWSLLRRRRIIATHRRGGTTVIGLPSSPHPARFEQVGNFGSRPKVDLTFAVPDPSLLPPLKTALGRALDNEALNTYTREPITPRLHAALAPRWPFLAEDWLAVNAGYEGLLLLSPTTFGPGESVAVENPTAPRLLDILATAGVKPLPVACDAEGPVPDSLAAALAKGAVAFLYQPRAQSPAGHAVSRQRSQELATVLKPTSVLVFEDDGIADVAQPELHTLGQHLPDRTVLVRSYSKSYGPDLRIAVMAGATAPIERVRSYRNFGARWTSRILQDALAYMLEDERTERLVARARTTYTKRRVDFANALKGHGVETMNQDGLSLWVPVANESHALVTLAAHGISVTPGKQFFTGAGEPYLRAATSHLTGGYQNLAEVFALAAAPPS
jgi:DNA-binding transcriptional MocR family regulator